MNTLHAMLSSDVVYRLGWALLHSLWLGCAAAALLCLAMILLRRRSAQARYLASCVALAAMLVGTILAGFLERPTFREAALPGMSSASSGSADRQFQPTQVNSQSDSSGPRVLLPSAISAGAPVAAPAGKPQTILPSDPPQFGARQIGAARAALPWAVLAWGIGVILMVAWQFTGWMAAYRIRRQAAAPADDALHRIIQRLASRLGVKRAVAVLESALVGVPMLVGWLRPVILLPLGFATGLPPDQLEAIFLHELAHVRRMDYLVNLLQRLVEAIFFYHPAAWFISRQIRREREHCCDDLAAAACGDATVYAEALLAAAGTPALRVAMAAGGGRLLPRIRRVLGSPGAGSNASAPIFAASVLLCIAGLAIVPIACSQSSTATRPSPSNTSANARASNAIERQDSSKSASEPATIPTVAPGHAVIDGLTKDQAIKNALDAVGLNATEVKSISAKVIKCPAIPFLQSRTAGKETWQIKLDGVSFPADAAGKKCIYIHDLAVVLAPGTGQVLSVISAWPKNEPALHLAIPTADEDQADLKGRGESFSGLPASPPQSNLVAAVRASEYWSAEVRQVVAMYVEKSGKLQSGEVVTAPVWVIRLRGGFHLPGPMFSEPGKPPLVVPDWQVDHLRMLVFSDTGKLIDECNCR